VNDTTPKTLRLGCDLDLSWPITVQKTSAPATGLTVTATATHKGTTLWTGTLVESGTTPGTYEGTMPAMATAALNAGDVVVLVLTSTSGGKITARMELPAVWEA
jgi:hypothetical protein